MLSMRLIKQIMKPLHYRKQRAQDPRKTPRRGVKVAVVGAAGRVGQQMSMLLKLNPKVTELCLYDRQCPRGVAADLSHICTSPMVTCYQGQRQLFCALHTAAIVAVPAAVPSPKPGTHRAEELYGNCCLVSSLAKAVSTACPSAFLVFITSPLNTMVPIAAEVLRQEDAYDPRRLFGLTTLNVMRARTFAAELLGADPQDVTVPVLGGHSEETILPILSQCNPVMELSPKDRERLVKRIQEASAKVIKAKGGKESATLATAYAGAHFIDALLKGINNEKNVTECAYVQSDVSEAGFFASPVLLGPRGIEHIHMPEINEFEEAELKCVAESLNVDIEVGEEFARD